MSAIKGRTAGLTVHVLPSNGATCKHEGSLRVRVLTTLRMSDRGACPEVGQVPSASLRVTRQREITDVGSNAPSSNDCLAIPREASLPAKFAYIPS